MGVKLDALSKDNVIRIAAAFCLGVMLGRKPFTRVRNHQRRMTFVVVSFGGRS